MSVIGADMRIIGRVYSPGVVKVAGTVLGNISADQALVMKGGKVDGNVNAREAIRQRLYRG